MSCVKTISLTDTAYERLLSWKEGRTFSEVIERLVPRKGTINAALSAAASLPKLSEKNFAELEHSVEMTRKKLPSAWN